jgi:hypothetical protein
MYETSPNSKMTKFYLDAPSSQTAGGTIQMATELASSLSPDDIQLSLFRNTLEACKAANVQHIIVMETPHTKDARQCAQLLDDTDVPFTYIRVRGDMQNFPDYTYAKGVQGDLNLESFTFSNNYN